MIDIEKMREIGKKADKGLEELRILNQLQDEALREHLLDCYREYRKKDGLKMLLEMNDALGGEAVGTDGSIEDVAANLIARTFNPALIEEFIKKEKENE